MQLIDPPYSTNAWDISTIKYDSTSFDPGTRQRICAEGQGLNDDIPKTLVTVQNGAGLFEVYATDAVNYFLFGEAMNLIYVNWEDISRRRLAGHYGGPFG